MANKMLIDAAHPEETRVVVLRGSRVEEFDFESVNKKQLRGNIYLAKVTRVEPSLQAAFVDYGGNRHGFLAFAEIHPDYYQIPFSDRQALLEAEAEEEPEEEVVRRPKRSRRRRGGEKEVASARRHGDETVSEDAEAPSDTSHLEMALQGSDEHEAPAHDASGLRDDDSHEKLNQIELGPDEHGGASGSFDDHAAEPSTLAHEDDHRPLERDAESKPPYDDPTPDLIARASAVHDQAQYGEPEPQQASATTDSEVGAPDHQTNHDLASSQAVGEDEAHRSHHGEAVSASHDDGELFDLAEHESRDDHRAGPVGEEPTEDQPTEHPRTRDHGRSRHRRPEHDEDEHDEEDEHVEQLGGDAMEEIPVRAHRARRQYKIQEVIKRRQVLLVQVVKEERGNKGAALTTYLSLAGRYSVLMPNTARGGGISRKITDATDRQRLKSIAQELEVPDGMGVILRTAGAARSKPEVKRDFEYLMRMWETVRETTLKSTAPTLVYEEGSLIKRAIRDLYNKDVEEVIVAGEEGYREAKDFMRLLMPSHSKNVQPWRDPAPIFAKAGAEAQLDAMFSSQVTLKSGGYVVINQTEALVAIDVNSGRSTREHNIEDTALRTNLEAADEVARQLRLRDLAGLIVVDFIDMEESRNNRAVERRLKEALKNDRARIQVGRISHFGLLEMSRQRIRTGVLEGSTVVCEHCAGAGFVRSTSSIALHVLRLLEDALLSDASRNIVARARSHVALYVLNHKRSHLADLEARFGVEITIDSDETLTGMQYCAIERGEPALGIVRPVKQIPVYETEPEDIFVEETAIDEDAVADEPRGDLEGGAPAGTVASRDDEDGRRRRRRRRGRGRDRESSGIQDDAPQPADDALAFAASIDGIQPAQHDETTDEPAGVEVVGEDGGAPREGRRRRSRRGGRRAREGRERSPEADEGSVLADGVDEHDAGEAEPAHMVDEPSIAVSAEADDRAAGHAADAFLSDNPSVHTPSSETAVSEPPVALGSVTIPAEPEAAHPAPADASQHSIEASQHASEAAQPATEAATAEPVDTEPMAPAAPKRPEPVSSELDPARPKRSGWWQRAKASLGG